MAALFTLLSFIASSKAASIADVRTLALADVHNKKNESVTVTGQITAYPGTFKDAYGYNTAVGFPIQDSSSGLYIYVGDQSFYDDSSKYDKLTLGRWVTITGEYDTDKPNEVVDPGGLVRVWPKQFSEILIGNLEDVPEPKVIAVDEVGDNQGLLVKVEDVNISHLITAGAWGTDFRATDVDGEDTSIWYYPSWNDSMVEVGTEYEYIIGFASVYVNCSDTHILEDVWEIWPRSVDDWKEKFIPTTEPSSAILTNIYSNAIIGLSVFAMLINNL